MLLTLLLQLCTPAYARPAMPVVFLGFDYSLARMIGTEDFADPAAIFPGYLDAWNTLWLTEKVEDTDKAIGPVSWEFDAVRALNQTASAAQIERRDGGPELVAETHLSTELLARQVEKYQTKATSGLGLVVVVDRLVKTSQQGCSWIVYFDLGTRKISASERVCEDARGFGFRNYWFFPMKELVDDMRRLKPKS